MKSKSSVAFEDSRIRLKSVGTKGKMKAEVEETDTFLAAAATQLAVAQGKARRVSVEAKEAKEGKEGKDGNKGKEKAPPPSGGEATAVDPAMAEKWKREDEALAKISAAEDAAAKNSAIDGHIAWANAFADQMESWGSNPQVPKSVIIVKLQERGIKYGKFLRKHKVHPSTAMAKITKTVKMGDLRDILRAFSEELEDSKVLTSTN